MPTERSTPDLFADALAEIKILARSEIRLVQAELSEKVAVIARSGVGFAVGAILMLAALIILLAAIADALVLFGLPHYAAEFIVAVAVMAIAGFIVLNAKRNLKPATFRLTKSMNQFSKSVAFIKAGGR